MPRSLRAALIVVLVFGAAAFGWWNVSVANQAKKVGIYASPAEARAALTRNPDDAIAHRTLAEDYLAGGRVDAAADEFRSAVRSDPTNRSDSYHLAVTLWRLKRTGEAFPIFKQLSAQNDDVGDSARKFLPATEHGR